MDTEAQMLLEDILTFCERDGREARLVNMLRQCTAQALSDETLTLEAPSRFAASYLARQQSVIEQYLEEITFAPLSLTVTLPQGEGPVPAPAAGRDRTAQAGTAPAPRSAVPTAPAGPVDKNIPPSGGPTADSGFNRTFSPVEAAHAPAGHSQAPAWQSSPGDTAPVDHGGVRNALSPADFQRLMAQMNGTGAELDARQAAAPAGTVAIPAAEPAPAGPAVGLNSKFTFESFVLGDENKLAYQSALRFAVFAEQPGTSDALFIYGHSGLGKTHLLMAIKNELAKDKPHLRVKYANSQAYIDDYMRSLAELKQDGNKIILQEYHAADVLIIDDIQNIIGKQSTIEQFFQLVDEFLRLNKKIAIASDRAPKELAMDERLTSRFNSGMLCLVSEPGFETKYAILKHYYETTILGQSAADYANVDADLLQSLQIEHGKLTDEQLRYMAEISGNNIRELESFCERCSHDAREKELSGAELTGDDIQEIANQYFDTAQKVIRVNTVQAVVEEFYQVAHKDLIGRKRTSNIASARHMAIYLTYELCSLSLNAIGAAFGGRDHATVINSIKVIEKRMGEDTQVSDDCQRLRTKIQLRS